VGDQKGGELRASKNTRFRSDIEGLRGVSIALVVLFHAGIFGFGGGFVGVDVFFVLSGFLITGLLVRESAETGRISLSQFYARRARRLLPAAALVLIVTLVASYFLLPSLLLPGIAIDTAAAALYVANMNFAHHATDYFSSGTAPSPILHFWSLSVEEQFYLFWPAIVLLVTRKARVPRINVRLTLIVVGVSSFAFAIWLLKFNAPWAFFSLPTRAWELALGGLLAVSTSSLEKLPKLAVRLFGWVGVSGVILSGIFIKSTALFPGVPALFPTISAALVLVAGLKSNKTLPTRFLESAPMSFLGRISYSLYLWHWPILVIPAALSVTPLPLAERISLALASIVLATITQRWVEDPLRKGRAIGIRPRWNLVTAMALALSVAGTAFAVNTVVNENVHKTTSTATADQNAARLDATLSSEIPTPAASGTPTKSATPSTAPTRKPTAVPRSTVSPKISTAPSTIQTPKLTSPSKPTPTASANLVNPSAYFVNRSVLVTTTTATFSTTTTTPTPSATTSTPTPSNTPTPTGSPSPTPTGNGGRSTTIDSKVPSNIAPSLGTARNDRALSYNDGCHTKLNMKPSKKPCLYGNLKGKKTIVLFGDSHALSWEPAMIQAAKSHGWKLLSLTMSACTPSDIPAWNPTFHSVMKNCPLWRKASIAKIIAAKPYVVIIAGTRGFATVDAKGVVINGTDRTAAYDAGMKRTIDKLKVAAKHIILLQDTPASIFDPPRCLYNNPASTITCATPVDKAISSSWQSEEHSLATDESIGIIDPSYWICPTAPCPVIIANLLVYLDPGHLTATFSAALGRRMGAAILGALH
jgi:peptidoglycan/LPS O-acetylase OafA/YrhL